MGRLYRCHALVMCVVIVSGNRGNEDSPVSRIAPVTSTGTSGSTAAEGLPTNEPPGGGNITRQLSSSGKWDKSLKWKPPKKCREPPVKGVCRAFIPTWFFEYKSAHCKIFIYGGCGGNDNNFRTEKKCQEVCLPRRHRKLVCSLKPNGGRGPLICRRWYFNENFGTCSHFPEGQCARNANGFRTCKMCMKRCSTLNAEEVCRLARESTAAPGIQQQQTSNNSLPHASQVLRPSTSGE